MNLRSRYFIVTVIAWLLFSFVVYVQSNDSLAPSPLGLINTLCLGLISCLLLLVTWFCPRKKVQFFYGALFTLLSVCGIAAAGREVWLNTHLPAAKFCFESKEQILPMLKSMPVTQFIRNTWLYGTNCIDGYAALLTSPFIFIYALLLILVFWQLTHVSRFGAHGKVGQRLSR